MRNISFASLVALPFTIGAGVIAYQIFVLDNNNYSILLIPLAIVLTLVFLFRPQLDFWWNTRNPPELGKPIIHWLTLNFPFYANLSVMEKEKFEINLALFLDAKEYFLMGKDKNPVPEDVKAAIVAHGMRICHKASGYLYGEYDRIVIYKHAFPTPVHKFLHAVEVHHEDGVLLFSMEHVMLGILRPDKFYNICYHAFIEIYIKLNPNLVFPLFDETDFESFEKLSGIKHEKVIALIGFPTIDPLIMAYNYYFSFNEAFIDQYPDKSKLIEQTLVDGNV